eukprot:SM000045S16215  [mRNA]  locus=s45:319258:321172:+ [translate_table: standard]
MQGLQGPNMGMRAPPPQAQPGSAYPVSHQITTELIQKYLDENKQLILAILDNQNLGKLNECAQYQARLQQNLMYLAAIADAQPQAPTPQQASGHSQGHHPGSMPLSAGGAQANSGYSDYSGSLGRGGSGEDNMQGSLGRGNDIHGAMSGTGASSRNNDGRVSSMADGHTL